MDTEKVNFRSLFGDFFHVKIDMQRGSQKETGMVAN